MATEMFEREQRHYLKELYSGEGRCRVESEVILPDYKEPAYRILRVDAKPRINSKNIYLQGQNIICEVEGETLFCVLYLSERQGEKGVPSAFMNREGFSYTFKIPASEDLDLDQVTALTETGAENLSFKLLGPRKISMRCDAVLSLNMKYNRHFACFSDQVPEDVRTRRRSVTMTSLTASCQEEISLSETIVLPKGYPAIGELCEMDVDLFCGKIRVEDGGVRFRGSCDLRCSYVSEGDESFISFYQPIDFEKSIGIDQCTSEQLCSISLIPNFLKGTADINEDGENKNLVFEIGCTAELRLYQNETVPIAEDAFSVQTQLHLEKEDLVCEELCGSKDFSVPVRATLPLTDRSFTRAEGLCWGVEFKNSYLEEDDIVIEGKLSFRYLGIDGEEGMANQENTHDFKVKISTAELELPEECADLRIEICGGARGLDLDVSGENLEIRYELCGQILVFCRHRFTAVSSMTRGDAWETVGGEILFLYTKEGDDLWSLCKTHHVTCESVRAENHMDTDALPRVIHITK